MKLKRGMSLSARSAWSGFLFVSPFLVGFLVFFLRPLYQSLVFMFSDVTVNLDGYVTDYVGIENLHYIFREDANFSENLKTSLVDLTWRVPIIVLTALFFAIILNNKFRGRIVVRAIFFLPVIIGSSIVLNLIQSDAAAGNAMMGEVVSGGKVSQNDVLEEILVSSGLSDKVVEFITQIVNDLFALIWKTGIQMIICLAGLQSIPSSLYEASSIEGATGWQNFWKITIPMLTPILFLVIIYTIVDSFTNDNNPVMVQVVSNAQLVRYGWASAMAWSYFLVIGIVVVLVFLAFRKVIDTGTQ